MQLNTLAANGWSDFLSSDAREEFVSHIAQLEPNAIEFLSPSIIASIDDLSLLTSQQLSALSSTQIASLDPALLRALSHRVWQR